MSKYDAWSKEKKQKFEKIAIIICEDMNNIIKNALINPSCCKDMTLRITKEDIEKSGFTMEDICEALEEFVYIC